MPPGWYLAGPLVAAALIGVLLCVLRWGIDAEADPYDEDWDGDGLDLLDAPPVREDYGLLTTAALVEDRRTAEEVRARLAYGGIRATYGPRRDGRLAVLVFPEEVEEARRLAAGGGTPIS
jgi:hypothetical protein